MTSVPPAAGERARARRSGGSVSSRQDQAEFVGETSCFQSFNPALPVERRATSRRPLPVSAPLWAQRPEGKGRGPAEAGELGVLRSHR